MIGTGGIGSGLFFAMRENHTLGREESRAGRFLDRRDYCKLHIISHYVKVLMGNEFAVVPLGKVGADSAGRGLVEEMRQVGLDLRYVQECPGEQTLFAVCFTYPDGSGGNLTPEDSACGRVDAGFIAAAEPEFARVGSNGIALAAAEVPLEARRELLSLATRYGFLRVASLVSAEIQPAMRMGLLAMLDLLAMNVDEAAMLINANAEDQAPEKIAGAAAEFLAGVYPRLRLSITAGKHGSWSWDGSRLAYQPAFSTQVVSTAGAGDAHLAGMIAGLAAGLSLPRAQELGSLCGAFSVTSPHTIAPDLERGALWRFQRQGGLQLSPEVAQLITDNDQGR